MSSIKSISPYQMFVRAEGSARFKNRHGFDFDASVEEQRKEMNRLFEACQGHSDYMARAQQLGWTNSQRQRCRGKRGSGPEVTTPADDKPGLPPAQPLDGWETVHSRRPPASQSRRSEPLGPRALERTTPQQHASRATIRGEVERREALGEWFERHVAYYHNKKLDLGDTHFALLTGAFSGDQLVELAVTHFRPSSGIIGDKVWHVNVDTGPNFLKKLSEKLKVGERRNVHVVMVPSSQLSPLSAALTRLANGKNHECLAALLARIYTVDDIASVIVYQDRVDLEMPHHVVADGYCDSHVSLDGVDCAKARAFGVVHNLLWLFGKRHALGCHPRTYDGRLVHDSSHAVSAAIAPTALAEPSGNPLGAMGRRRATETGVEYRDHPNSLAPPTEALQKCTQHMSQADRAMDVSDDEDEDMDAWFELEAKLSRFLYALSTSPFRQEDLVVEEQQEQEEQEEQEGLVPWDAAEEPQMEQEQQQEEQEQGQPWPVVESVLRGVFTGAEATVGDSVAVRGMRAAVAADGRAIARPRRLSYTRFFTQKKNEE